MLPCFRTCHLDLSSLLKIRHSVRFKADILHLWWSKAKIKFLQFLQFLAGAPSQIRCCWSPCLQCLLTAICFTCVSALIDMSHLRMCISASSHSCCCCWWNSRSLYHQVMDGPGDNDPDLISAAHPRFCEAVKTDTVAYTSLFTRTFQNKTFHVYRVKKKRKKSGKSSSEGGVTQ